jgi:hypothetical protein
MARFSQRANDGVASALGIHLFLYCAVAGCLVFGLYALMQPSRSPNPGLAAYKPLPGTVVNYAAPAQARERTEPPAAAVLLAPEPETTGLAMRAPEPPAVETLPLPAESTRPAPPPTRTGTRNRARAVDSESPKRAPAACIPAYDSSGAQTRPCG